MSKSALIVVHGMGEQRRNSSLIGVARSLISLMKARGKLEPGQNLSVSGDVAFRNQSDAQVEYGGRTWRFAEYWWAQSFIPAAPAKVASWIAWRLAHHLVSLRKSFVRAWYDMFGSDQDKDPWKARVYNLFALPLYAGLMLLLFVLTPLLMLLLVLLGYVKLVPGIPRFIAYFQKLLATIGVDMLGDIYIYLKDPVQSALIRDGLIRMIEEAVLDDEVDRLVFLAHSTGNLLVYDALAHVNANPSSTEVAARLGKVSAFISIGSILPMAWNRRIVGEIEERFARPMPADLHWYHLWTRFDVGPAGPLEVPAAVQGGPDVCNRRVNNADDLLLDHTGYWDNLEQVHTLVLEEMGGMDASNDFWRGPGLRDDSAWHSRSAEAWEDFNMRRRTVAELAFVRLIGLFTLPNILALFLWFNGWAKGTLDFLKIDRLAAAFGWKWLRSAVDSADLSVEGTFAIALIASLLIFAGVFIIYFFGYKQIAWARHFDGARRARHEAFKLRRESGWPVPASATAE